MDFLEETSVLLERISLIAELSARAECGKAEKEMLAIWISEMASAANEELLKVVFNSNSPGKIH